MAGLQTVNTPIQTNFDGQVIENLDLYVTSGDAITVTNDNVIIRNCRIHHQGGDGISLSGASNVTIENCEIINSSPPTGNGPETSASILNILAYASPNLTVDHVTLRDGSSGIYLLESPGATLSNVEGFNFHGPFPRGQFVQFDKSGNSSLTNFYVYNDPAHSHVEDNVSVYSSQNVTISNGVIDGNNSPSGVGVMFEGNSSGGKVDHVDAIHMGNGAFSSYSPNVTFDYTRSFDNIATDQGRGLPASNALIWNISNTGIRIEHSTYTDPGNSNNIAWDRSKAVIVDVHQDLNAIPMGDSVTNDFAWDNPTPPPENHLPLITSNGGGATASVSVAENTTAVTKVVATDSDTGQTLAYSIVPVSSGGGADASKFVIDATTGALAFQSAPNFEAPTDALAAANVYDVTVQVSDNKGGIDKQAIAVTVTDQLETPPPPPPPLPPENHLPLITSNGGGATASVSVAENTTAVTKVVATDSDTGQTLTYSIVPVASGGGADASKFVIDATTGALAFQSAPNFEAPTDALAAANVYDVTVQVSDNKGGIDKQAIAVTVTDQLDTPPPPPPPPPPPENHLPLITSNGGGATASVSVAENTTAMTKVVATDSDTGQTLAYSIVPVSSGGGADASKFVIDATTGALAFQSAPNFEAPTDALAAANVYDVTVQVSDNKGGIDKQAIAVTVTDQLETPPPPPPPDDLVLRGGRGTDHLTGGDGNDQIRGARGNDVLAGHAGNDIINGNSGKDYLLLDGSMQDYTIAVTKRGVTITDSTGDVDTVKNVEVFHFSDGTNYLVGRQGLAQTSDQTINTFLAASGVDQSHLGPVSTAQAQQTTILGQALNQTGHTQGDKLLTGAALWKAVDAASNVPTHTDTQLADLKQQLHDAFDHHGGANLTVDELAASLHLTHHE